MQRHTSNPASSDLVSIQDLIISKLEQNSLELKYSFSVPWENRIHRVKLGLISIERKFMGFRIQFTKFCETKS